MTALILDGKKIRDEAIPALVAEVKEITASRGRVPTLAIIQVGERDDSNSYIKGKKSFADKIGATVKHIQVPENTSQSDLIDQVKKLNEDVSVDGIIVQLPLPLSIDSDNVIDTILPTKDVDSLTAFNVKKWLDGNEDVCLPATAAGIRRLLGYYKIDLFGKKVVVVGRSTLVGKPIIAMCLNENATVTVCHSKTKDLPTETKSADIVIVVTGKPGVVSASGVREGQVIIDVGINTVFGEKLDDEIVDKKLVGDVDFDAVLPVVAAITPVPGGVGPMTVLALFENLLHLAKKS